MALKTLRTELSEPTITVSHPSVWRVDARKLESGACMKLAENLYRRLVL
jgi:hypothetical protein